MAFKDSFLPIAEQALKMGALNMREDLNTPLKELAEVTRQEIPSRLFHAAFKDGKKQQQKAKKTDTKKKSTGKVRAKAAGKSMTGEGPTMTRIHKEMWADYDRARGLRSRFLK